MENAEIVGSLAATLTTACFLPQVWHIIRHKQTAGISLLMYIVFFCGICCWFTYGLLIGSWPIIISNTITIGLVLIIISMKIRYK